MKGKKIVIFASVVSLALIGVTKSVELTMLQEAAAFIGLTAFLACCEIAIEVGE
ncbi:hypothetical protein VP236O401_P0004 [Vibrio phage 236O40-1]|nr:hypothetical protein VP236O401_P0004 [Vibrio phage 236O40-1]